MAPVAGTHIPSRDFFVPGPLQDELVGLQLVRTSFGDDTRWHVPTYHFRLVLLSTDESLGRLTFRAGVNAVIRRVRGQIACLIDEPHRGHGYATRACRILMPFARAHGFGELCITCDPSNIASRRTLEHLGAQFVDIVDVPSQSAMYQEGLRQKCRYRLAL
jgi:tagatose 1,6-diphosphate aldolase